MSSSDEKPELGACGPISGPIQYPPAPAQAENAPVNTVQGAEEWMAERLGYGKFCSKCGTILTHQLSFEGGHAVGMKLGCSNCPAVILPEETIGSLRQRIADLEKENALWMETVKANVERAVASESVVEEMIDALELLIRTLGHTTGGVHLAVLNARSVLSRASAEHHMRQP